MTRRPAPLRRRLRDDRGETNTAMILNISLSLLLLMLMAQVAGAGMAYLVARNAANQALQAARVQAGTNSDGTNTANTILTNIDPHSNMLGDTTVTVTRTGTTVTVTITGTAPQVFPFVHVPIHVTSPHQSRHRDEKLVGSPIPPSLR